MAAATFTPTDAVVTGHSKYGVTSDGKRVVEGLYVPSTSYATGGDAVVIGDLTVIDRVEVIADSANPGYGVRLAGTSAAPLVKLMAAGAEVASTTNLSAQTFKLRFVGA